jgi:hypothetical protein
MHIGGSKLHFKMLLLSMAETMIDITELQAMSFK